MGYCLEACWLPSVWPVYSTLAGRVAPEALADAVRTDGDVEVRVAATKALGSLAVKEAIPAIAVALNASGASALLVPRLERPLQLLGARDELARGLVQLEAAHLEPARDRVDQVDHTEDQCEEQRRGQEAREARRGSVHRQRV